MAAAAPCSRLEWRLWPGVRLELIDGHCSAQGGHVERPTALADVIELGDAQHFLLHGRTADLVNIAGKRSSLAYLNHQLSAIPGVVDGAFFVRDDAEASLAGVTRLAALVVALRLDAARHHAGAARAHRSGVPAAAAAAGRALPRNDTGKLPQQTLRALIAQAAVQQPHLFA